MLCFKSGFELYSRWVPLQVDLRIFYLSCFHAFVIEAGWANSPR